MPKSTRVGLRDPTLDLSGTGCDRQDECGNSFPLIKAILLLHREA